MQKIFLDLERMKYPYTGLNYFCLNLVKALLKLDQNQFRFTGYLPKKLSGIFGDKLDYYHFQFFHPIFLPVLDADVWHMTYQQTKFFPPSKKTKALLTVHDLNYLYEHAAGSRQSRKYPSKVQKRVDRADHIVCISEYAKKDLIEHLNVEGKTISVIYNGCNFVEGIQDHRPTYQPSRPFLFTIGTVVAKKNFHVLPALLQSFDGELIIAGTHSSYVETIISEAKKFNVHERVKIIGPISDADKGWYYSQCTAFVFPSLAEGFGLPVLEAMYHQKPVFLSDRTSLPEVGGDLAYYFKSFDPDEMQRTFRAGMNHVQTIDRMALRRWALKFSWEESARKYFDTYASLVK